MVVLLLKFTKVKTLLFLPLKIYRRFSCHNKKSPQGTTIDASKSGVHVNFEPKFTAVIGPVSPGQRTSVSINYYAKIKVASGLVVGILTGGLSVAVGAGTLTAHLADAKSFVDSLW
jgi:hypothetical protein